MGKRPDDKGKKGSGFNSPFKGLRLEAPSPPKVAAPPPREPQRPLPPSEEDALFLEAMAGVEPLPSRPSEPPRPDSRPRLVDDEAESLAQLAELVSGHGGFDIHLGDQSIEGGAPDLDRRVLTALRRGEYAVEGHLDLHGMTRAQARDAVEAFLLGARRDGKRCVLLIHGRGLNSKDQLPVLKEQLRTWLGQGRVGRSVLAFSSARPRDGGTGALYVLLRR